jgi:hypothetical protein
VSTRIASVRACPAHTSDRLQNGPIQLFGIDPQPTGICLNDGEPANELSVSLPFLLQFGFQLDELILEKALFDSGTG